MGSDQVSSQVKGNQGKFENYSYLIVEYGFYLYIFMSFFDKGEGLRNIGLYSSLAGWWILLLLGNRVKIFFNIITVSFLVYLLSILLSTFFSIDPYYSFTALKKDVFKAIIIFFIVSTCFNNEMLLRVGKVISFSGLIVLCIGFHSFILGDADFYTSENAILFADKNKYGFFIGLFLPFFLMFSIQSKLKWEKAFWMLAAVWAISAVVFSVSRGAMCNVFTAVVIFAFAFLKRRHVIATFIFALILIISAVSSYKFLPTATKFAFSSIPKHIVTFNERTYLFWEPALEAVKKRPLLGWGYGKMVYRNPLPFENGKQPDWEKKGGLHSTFIKNLFHQGIIGLMSYLFLLFSTVFVLVKMFKNEADEKKLLALTLLSIIIGSFFVNSFVKVVPFRILAVILGITAALSIKKSDGRRNGGHSV